MLEILIRLGIVCGIAGNCAALLLMTFPIIAYFNRGTDASGDVLFVVVPLAIALFLGGRALRYILVGPRNAERKPRIPGEG